MNLGATELLIILAVVLLLFGSTRLPKLAKSLGQASKEFKKGVDGEDDDDRRDQERLTGPFPVRRPRRAGTTPREPSTPVPSFLSMADGVPTWEEVARDYGRFLYNVAYRLAGNDDDAQDLVQESLIRVRKGLERYEPGSLEGWLARIVTNVFLDEVRRRKRRPADALPDDPDAGAAHDARRRRGAHRPLRRGPARARRAARRLPGAGRAL